MGAVQVDVRLDDVVLRALERNPSRRYQHASQVKTAVESISSTAPPPPTPNADALAQRILAGDYNLSIKSCLKRGWALVRANFWPLVGVNALMVALMFFTGALSGVWLGMNPPQTMSVLSMFIVGPLYGGLYYYFLKRIRDEPTTIETAFAGFSQRFLHLFLAGFVTHILIGLGFFCLLLPGIYLFVAWTFTLPLVMDQGLDFWTAMEVTRKVVTRHWWKLLGLNIVLALVSVSGILACGVGLFVTSQSASPR